MRKILLGGCLALTLVTLGDTMAEDRPRVSEVVQPYLAHAEPIIALVGSQVIDGSGEPPRVDQTVVMERGRISRLGPTKSTPLPKGAKVLRRPDSTVIPGLVGLHDHTHMPGIRFMGFSASRLWLASGVTTVQTAGSADPKAEATLAQAIRDSGAVGPTIFPTAHYLTGPGGNAPMSKPATEEAARKFVRDAVQADATLIKLYRHIQPTIAAAVIEEAHRLGIQVTGHLCSMTFRDAAFLGIDRLEHGLISASDFVPDKSPGECTSNRASLADLALDDPRIEELIALLVREEVTVTSTLAIIESHFPHRPQADERSLALMSPRWRQRYDERQANLQKNRSTTMTPTLFSKLMAFERRFSDAGGHLVMGPDPGRHVLPGFGNQRGFELLVEAGFNVPEAVRIATANGAEELGVADEVGRIALGYAADLVVLDGNLAADPSAIRRVEVVFKAGLGYDPAKLVADVKGQVGLR